MTPDERLLAEDVARLKRKRVEQRMKSTLASEVWVLAKLSPCTSVRARACAQLDSPREHSSSGGGSSATN